MHDERVIAVEPLIAYIKAAQQQAVKLYDSTENLMWIGEVIAYQHILEAIELGSIGEATA